MTPPKIILIADNNRNGIPEISLLTSVMSQGGHSYQVFEWDGTRFASLIPPEDSRYPDSGGLWAEATGKIHYEDIDHDLVRELILDSGIPVWSIYYDGLPWRNQRTYYKWNGRYFVPSRTEFALPEFRFQAAQDGDLAVSQKEYEKAIDLYQQVIFSDQLKPYSPEIRQNLRAHWENQHQPDQPTPTPVSSDPTEYPRLAAYARFRMVALHVHLGEMDAATVQFNTLQTKFPDGDPGHPYVEMATAFWDAYQSSGNMTAACGAAIQYAAEHPEILVPLGSDYHGWQSHIYVPADVCPFR